MSKSTSTSSAKKKIVVVDDHPIIRQGIVQLINEDPGLEVVGQAEDINGALDVIGKSQPDLAVVDITLKDSSGIDVIKEVGARWSSIPVLVFSMHDESFYAERVLRAGAKGFVTKGEPSTKIIEGIHRVLGGEVFVSEKIAAGLLRKMAGGQRETEKFSIDRLSDREFEVFGMIGDGKQTRDIAEQLHLSVKTVESHRENIKRKLNIDSATELLQRAIYWVKFERGN